jgi:hypothetical protein
MKKNFKKSIYKLCYVKHNGLKHNGFYDSSQKARNASKILFYLLEGPMFFEDIAKIFFPNRDVSNRHIKQRLAQFFYRRNSSTYGCLGWLVDKKLVKKKKKPIDKKITDKRGGWKRVDKTGVEEYKKFLKYPCMEFDINFGTVADMLVEKIIEKSLSVSLRSLEHITYHIPPHWDDGMKEIQKWKKELASFISKEEVRKELFNSKKWSFLFNKHELLSSFESVFGFLNFCFLLSLIEYRKQKLDKQIHSFNKSIHLDLLKQELIKTIMRRKFEKKVEFIEVVNGKPRVTREYIENEKHKKNIEEGFKTLTLKIDDKFADVLALIYANYFGDATSERFSQISIFTLKQEDFYNFLDFGVRRSSIKEDYKEFLPLHYFYLLDIPRKFDDLISM